MKRILLTCVPLLASSLAYAGGFSPGTLVLLRDGDGTAALASSATAVFLQEFTTAGLAVQTIGMPTLAVGGNRAFTISGSATSEGFLHRTSDGKYLVLAGYDAVPGTAGPNSATAAVINRVLGRVNAFGTVDTSTAISSGTSGNFRSAASVDGNSFWASSSTANAGYIAPLGATAATQLAGGSAGGTGPSNMRVVRTFNGQLYGTANSGAFVGLLTMGTGLPTSSGTLETLTIGTGAGSSPYDFYLADLNAGIAGMDVAWVADDRTSGAGGIQRYDFNGTTWSLSYTLGGSSTSGAAAVTVDLSGASPVIYALSRETGNAVPNRLLQIIDIGALSPVTVLATAAANTQWRGLDFAPVIPEPTGLFGFGLMAMALGRWMLGRRA